MSTIIYPQPLMHGDNIAIVSPAGIVRQEFIEKSVDVLMLQGWNARVGQSTLNKCGSYSGTVDQRLADIQQALQDSSVRAIVCSRGGYGCVHLLESLSKIDLTTDPKWLIGFSDVTALHALFQSQGVASIHASMTKHLAEYSGEDPDSQSLFSILRGELPSYQWQGHEYNRNGRATGRLLGGNLAILQSLINTPYDMICPDAILFIEDISEQIYEVERMLWQLKLSGKFGSLRGLIIGQFTNYESDANYRNMYEMIDNFLGDIDLPVAFNAPIGHVSHNIPLVVGSQATLLSSPNIATLKLEKE